MCVCVCVEGEGSCRNCCPSNSKGGNPLPGDAPLHKSTRSNTTRRRPARKSDKVQRSLHRPICICNTFFYLSSSSSYLPKFWARRRKASAKKLNSAISVGLCLGWKHCRAKVGTGPTQNTQGPVPV